MALDLANRFWEGLLEAEPILGTEVGDERFDDRLPDPSEEGLSKQRDLYEGALRELEALGRATLTEDTRTSLDILEAISRRELDLINYRMDRLTAVMHIFGPSNLLADIGSMQRADTPERVDRLIGRFRAFPKYMRDLSRVVEQGARHGPQMPGLVVERTVAQVERMLSGRPEESPGMAPAAKASPEDKERVAKELRESVWPAYQTYLEALRAYLPSATETIGLYALQNGDAMYASRVRAYTTLPLDARRVHELGVEDLKKIQDERRQIAERLGYPDAESAVAAHTSSGRNTASSKEELIRLVEDQVRRSWEAAPEYFGRLPRGNCTVRPVEEFREKDMPGAFYQPPTADGSRSGVYYVNASDLPQRPLHHVATTTYHEANPGHHFQISIEYEFADRPALRRFGGFLAGSAFTEGWGLYSERLADQMGLFVDDYERLGMLEAQGHRAARLIVDTGIHAFGWDRDRSIRQLQEAGVPSVDAVIEVDRYIAWPGQALAYKIGQFEIERWRGDAEKRQGPEFSLRNFHDRLLALGSLPLPALERELANGRTSD
ncbi:MAG: DUF885 domain-containing protein [Actinomycetota bacterium]|nr:DUF885 domain-containing protein [Actinomycetota bacterium]